MPVDRLRFVRIVTLLAGAMDATTGLVLALAPTAALGVFGVSVPGGDDVLMRFVGAFVAGVGLAYLWAVVLRQAEPARSRLPGVWGATAIIRACVALFCFSAVAGARLASVWLIVGTTDAALAGLQITLLRAGWLD